MNPIELRNNFGTKRQDASETAHGEKVDRMLLDSEENEEGQSEEEKHDVV